MKLRFATLVLGFLIMACKTGQLGEAGIEACLKRTDFAGHNADLRAAIGWYIDYGIRVKETTCCALQPRPDLLAKRSDLGLFKSELLQRVDILETQSLPGAEKVSRNNNACYGALMDLYHELRWAYDRPRKN